MTKQRTRFMNLYKEVIDAAKDDLGLTQDSFAAKYMGASRNAAWAGSRLPLGAGWDMLLRLIEVASPEADVAAELKREWVLDRLADDPVTRLLIADARESKTPAAFSELVNRIVALQSRDQVIGRQR